MLMNVLISIFTLVAFHKWGGVACEIVFG